LNWHFRTLGMGTINYRKSASRLASEVMSTGLFTSSMGWSEEYLQEKSPKFWKNHATILKARVPGFGWWIWKPEFIRLSLNEIPEGDGLFYLDAGSFVDTTEKGLRQLNSYFNLGEVHSVLAAHGQEFREKNYSSSKLMSLLDLSSDQQDSFQHYAGCLFVRNNRLGRDFIDEWSYLACANQHEFLYPIERTSGDNDLVHHMYDQAILSCLIKSHNFPSIEIGDKGKDGAIRVLRHRFAFGIYEKKSSTLIFYKSVSALSRIKLAIEHRIFRKSLKLRPLDHNFD
jgi:hypothetical protein